MNDEIQRLKRLLIVFGVITLLLLVGFVIFVSFELRHLKSQISIQPRETVIERPAALEFPTIQALKGDKGDSVVGSKGDKGDKGDPGQVDYAALAALVRQTVQEQPKPENGVNGQDGKDGANAREIELCKLPVTLEIGQRFVGTTICLPIEVGE